MFNAIVPQLTQLCSEVGELIMGCYSEDMCSQTKADNTPVTIADHKAHQMIVKALSEITPDIPILSEESEHIDYTQRQQWSEYWLVDPLDGTRDFLDRTGEFCICIAYIKNHKSVFGMVYAPSTKTHYYTTDEQTTYKHQGQQLTQLKTQADHSPREVVIGHHSIGNPQLKQHLDSLSNHRVSKLGSAIKFCQIAEGIYDYYPRFGPCSEWDTAAGTCILRCAGGVVMDENNQELRYNTKADLTSPIFFALNKAQ